MFVACVFQVNLVVINMSIELQVKNIINNQKILSICFSRIKRLTFLQKLAFLGHFWFAWSFDVSNAFEANLCRRKYLKETPSLTLRSLWCIVHAKQTLWELFFQVKSTLNNNTNPIEWWPFGNWISHTHTHTSA